VPTFHKIIPQLGEATLPLGQHLFDPTELYKKDVYYSGNTSDLI